jgi:holin-like protein
MTLRKLAGMSAAFGTLAGFDALGGVVARSTHLPIPGTVLGLLGLLGALLALGRVPAPMEELARLLMDHLSLLYIPAAVGAVGYASLVRRDAWPIAAALTGSAFVGLVVTGWTFQLVDRHLGRDAR